MKIISFLNDNCFHLQGKRGLISNTIELKNSFSWNVKTTQHLIKNVCWLYHSSSCALKCYRLFLILSLFSVYIRQNSWCLRQKLISILPYNSVPHNNNYISVLLLFVQIKLISFTTCLCTCQDAEIHWYQVLFCLLNICVFFCSLSMLQNLSISWKLTYTISLIHIDVMFL